MLQPSSLPSDFCQKVIAVFSIDNPYHQINWPTGPLSMRALETGQVGQVHFKKLGLAQMPPFLCCLFL